MRSLFAGGSCPRAYRAWDRTRPEFPSRSARGTNGMRVDAGQTFNFFPIPTDIHFGFGIRRSLPERLKSLGARRAFLVTDPGLRTAGILDELIAILSEGAIEATACDRVKPDSGSELIDLAAKELKDCGADVVIG